MIGALPAADRARASAIWPLSPVSRHPCRPWGTVGLQRGAWGRTTHPPTFAGARLPWGCTRDAARACRTRLPCGPPLHCGVLTRSPSLPPLRLRGAGGCIGAFYWRRAGGVRLWFPSVACSGVVRHCCIPVARTSGVLPCSRVARRRGWLRFPRGGVVVRRTCFQLVVPPLACCLVCLAFLPPSVWPFFRRPLGPHPH